MEDKGMDLAACVEGRDGVSVIRGHGNCRDWNGIHYRIGMSGKNVGAKELSMNVATIPPGGVAYAHIHDGFEVMLYILEGRVRHEYGPGLRQSVENAAGDFIRADLASVSAAAAGAIKTMPDDFRVSITNAPGKTAYPVSSFTWLLIPSKFSDASKRDALKNFIKWMLTDGQNSTESLAYAKLPTEVVAKETKALSKIQ